MSKDIIDDTYKFIKKNPQSTISYVANKKICIKIVKCNLDCGDLCLQGF